jgi:cytochrome c553
MTIAMKRLNRRWLTLLAFGCVFSPFHAFAQEGAAEPAPAAEPVAAPAEPAATEAGGPAAATAATGSVDAGKTKSLTCSACHGVDGNSVAPDWPSLAGQHAGYIVRQLQAYKSGERQDVTMSVFAMQLSDQDMADVAAYFASQTRTPKGADPAAISLGQQIYRGGIPERGIAACIACHGPTGQGNPLASYPNISNQHSAYLSKTLTQYKLGERRSDADYNQMMRNTAEMLLENEITALAGYVQGLR